MTIATTKQAEPNKARPNVTSSAAPRSVFGEMPSIHAACVSCAAVCAAVCPETAAALVSASCSSPVGRTEGGDQSGQSEMFPQQRGEDFWGVCPILLEVSRSSEDLLVCLSDFVRSQSIGGEDLLV